MTAKISLTKSNSHYEGVKNSLSPLKEDIIKNLSRLPWIVVKVNLVITKTPHYKEGVKLATTPFQAVKSFIDFILPFYKGQIVIAEEAAWGDTDEGFKMYGFAELAENNPQISLLNTKKDQTTVMTVDYREGTLELPFSKTMVEAPFLVSIARPKTHCTTGMTASIKNVVVGAIQKHSMRNRIHKGKAIHQIMAEISTFVYPTLAVIDGTVGMEGEGPIRGTEIKSGWALSSFDALAADSLAAYLMGFDCNYIGYLRLLEERKAGFLFPDDDMEILGEDPKKLAGSFRPHRNYKTRRK